MPMHPVHRTFNKGYAILTAPSLKVKHLMLQDQVIRVGERAAHISEFVSFAEVSKLKNSLEKRRVFISSKQPNNDTLYHLFAIFGQVQDAYYIKNLQTGLLQNYGFVLFATPKQAQNAVRAQKVGTGKSKVMVKKFVRGSQSPSDFDSPTRQANGKASRGLRAGLSHEVQNPKKAFNKQIRKKDREEIDCNKNNHVRTHTHYISKESNWRHSKFEKVKKNPRKSSNKSREKIEWGPSSPSQLFAISSIVEICEIKAFKISTSDIIPSLIEYYMIRGHLEKFKSRKVGVQRKKYKQLAGLSKGHYDQMVVFKGAGFKKIELRGQDDNLRINLGREIIER